MIELTAGLAATCCTTLQYLEGAAYIAIVLAVLGVPQLLTYYFDRRDRRHDRVEAERARREEREAVEQARREEREAAERRHQEMMTALIALLERNGNASSGQFAIIEQLQRRIGELEAENARLRNGDGNGGSPPHVPASE